MAFKIALIAAMCIAQGFALRGMDACKNPAAEIPFEFEQATHGIDQVRDTVSVAAAEAYAKGNNLEVVVACFREQRENFVALGRRLFSLTKDASQEIAAQLGEKAEKYEKIMEVPLRNIAITLRALPETVYNFIKNKEYAKAAEAIRQARKIVEENSRALAQAVRDMTEEVPEVADRTEELAREINEEARKGCDAIDAAIRECIAAGGPKTPVSEDEENEPSEE